MKKCCFIIPYFGKFPNYFQLFLNSCSFNRDYNWLIFTDDETLYKYPENVKRVLISYDEMKSIIQSRFDFDICIPLPYKLCDLKPMYGFLFSEYLSEFRFWGHCDVDTILGNLSHFITDEMLDKYDKMFCLGHMTIYRNTPENNQLFMSRYKGRLLYKEVLQSNQIFVFDEENRDEYNINRMFLDLGKNVYCKDLSLNINLFYPLFRRIRHIVGSTYETEKYKSSICVWDNGNIFRYYFEKGILKVEEFMYIHLQGRKMEMQDSSQYSNTIQIVPNEFIPLEKNSVKAETFGQYRKYGSIKQLFRMTKVYLYCNRLMHPRETVKYLYYKYFFK